MRAVREKSMHHNWVAVTYLMICGAMMVLSPFFTLGELDPRWMGYMLVAAGAVLGGLFSGMVSPHRRLNEQATAGVAVVVTAYAVWQILSTTDASVLALLERPEISTTLDLLDPLVRAELIDRIPGLIRLTYLLIIPVVWLGCGAMSAYYFFRGRVAVDGVGSGQ